LEFPLDLFAAEALLGFFKIQNIWVKRMFEEKIFKGYLE